MARRLVWIGAFALVAGVAFATGWITGRTGIGSAVAESSLTDVERQFTTRMREAALVGHFTIDGRETREPRPDRYDVSSVAKVGDDLWQFNVRMRHDGMDAALPITVPMRFVGDTAMVMMTEYSLPTLGTFTVRVFFYGDRYAGSWQHGRTGGLLYGRIERQRDPAAASPQ